MESPKENLQPLDKQVRLYCGSCDTECDYMGVEPSKILGFVCMKCMEFNEVETEGESKAWVYATNHYATVSADYIQGGLWKLSPIAKHLEGSKIEKFIAKWKPTRLYILTQENEICQE